MTVFHAFPKRILLCGTFDRQMAAFAAWAKKTHHSEIGALSSVKYASIAVDEWRTGMLTTDGAHDHLISGFDAAVWFCLTPTECRTRREGSTHDIMMMSAIQFIRAVRKMNSGGRNMRVIFVTRAFPGDDRDLGEMYNLWWQIYKLFEKECPNLNILRISPEISKNDALTLSLFERALRTRQHPAADGGNLEWLNLTRPLLPGVLNSEIERTFMSEPNIAHIVQGSRIVSYDEWFAMISGEMPPLYACMPARVLLAADPEAGIRKKILRETIRFHTMNEDDHYSHNDRGQCDSAIQNFTEDILDEMKHVRHLLLKPEDTKENTEFCYIKRISDAPNRSLIEVAELLTYWLPLYFKRSLNLEEINDRRVICKLSHIPLFEIERRDSGRFLCQLFLRWPWKHHMETRIGITLASTPGDARKPGILLAACENSPDNILWRTIFSRIIRTFGIFIREYS